MKDRKIRALAVGLVLAVGLATAAGWSVRARDDASGPPPPVERVASTLKRLGATSVIIFVSDGEQEYAATAGAPQPPTDQRFRIGSVTKTFTATIVLQLVDEGKLRLSDSLDDFLPGVVPRGDEITIRYLLGHRSGLVNITDYPTWMKRAERSRRIQPIGTLRFAASHPLAFEPGSQFRYSNTNFIALGLVIEKATGHAYSEELERRILAPLELDATELPSARRLSDLDDAGFNPRLAWAAGAIVSNVHDLSRFYSALLSGRLLSRPSLAKMTGPPVVATSQVVPGLGIFPSDLSCGRFWGHNGLILDYGTSVTASAKGDRVAVVSLRGREARVASEKLLCPAHGHTTRPVRDIAPSWSPDGRKIAFLHVHDRMFELRTMNADGSRQRTLTRYAVSGVTNFGWTPDVSPVWSPDGRKIAFVTGRTGKRDIYVMGANGSGQRRLTRNVPRDRYPGFELISFAPAWSPDGRKIAIVSAQRGAFGIDVVNPDGRERRRLVRSTKIVGDVAWSADGTRIAFLGAGGVNVVNTDGSGQRLVTRVGSRSGFLVSSPGGQGIALASTDNRCGGEFCLVISILNADGSGLHPLTQPVAFRPAWSPDGRKIAFVAGETGRYGVYVVNAGGSGRRRLALAASDPAWSPDGRRIAFESQLASSRGIHVLNVDGSGRRRRLTQPAQ